MKSLMVLYFTLSLLCLSLTNTHATPLGDAIRELDRGRVLVWSQCQYEIILKESKDPKVIKTTDGMGNGFFFDHQYDLKPNIHAIVTAKHVVNCALTVDSFLGDELKIDSIKSFAVYPKISVMVGGMAFPAKLGDYEIHRQNIDLAILETVIPKNISHFHSPLLPEGVEFDLGSLLTIRGFMPFPDSEFEKDKDGWISRFQNTHLENISDDGLLLQLANSAYSGQSGSGVYYYHNGKFYIVGVVIMSAANGYGTIDTSWATRLKKEHFTERKKS